MSPVVARIGAWTSPVLVAILISASPALAAGPAAGGDTTATPPPRDAAPAFVQRVLSDERDTSRWAYVERRVWARSAPHGHGHRVKRLTTRTPDRTSELVLLLDERKYDDGTWVRVRLPMRPNNTTGWLPRSALSGYHIVRTQLVVDRAKLTAKLYKRSKLVWFARVGIGKAGTKTPAGHFYIRDRLIPVEKNSVYGVYAFGTSAYSKTLTDWPGGGIIGVHGTNEPGLLPGRVSHGCVRVRNAKMLRLKKLMPVGTPVLIL